MRLGTVIKSGERQVNSETWLNKLFALRPEGDGLEKFEAIVKHTEYDSSIPYDMGKCLMQDEKKSKAGRKPLGKVVIMKSIKLTPELWDRAKLIGEGNASKGIRESLLAFNLKEGQEND